MEKLTQTQEKLLKVMTDPENWGKTYTELAKITGCSRNTVYLAVKNDYFVKRYNDIAMTILGSRTGDIINASVKNALKREGFNDRKLLLTITGIYKESPLVSNNNVGNVYFGKPTADGKLIIDTDVDYTTDDDVIFIDDVH